MKKYDVICSKLNIEEKDIENYLKTIQGLNPIPSRGFYMGDNVRFIQPDAEIKNVDGVYRVVMLESSIPRIKLKSEENGAENSPYFKNYFNSAHNLIKCLEKRQITLENILNIILDRQYEYFSNPEGKLNSLTLKDISSVLKMHNSTVSRAVKNKYILTERGIERIKDMFIADSKKITAKDRIEELILNEDRENPLSDSKIAEILAEEDIHVARRTVVKYREELGIKPSHKRKLKDN